MGIKRNIGVHSKIERTTMKLVLIAPKEIMNVGDIPSLEPDKKDDYIMLYPKEIIDDVIKARCATYGERKRDLALITINGLKLALTKKANELHFRCYDRIPQAYIISIMPCH